MSTKPPSALTKDQYAAFFEKVTNAGLSMEQFETTQRVEIVVETLDQWKSIIGRNNSEKIEQPIPKSKMSLKEMAELYVENEIELTARELAECNEQFFPFKATVIAEQDRTVRFGETWVLGEDEPTPIVLHYGKITMEPTSRIEVYSSYVILTAEEFERQ